MIKRATFAIRYLRHRLFSRFYHLGWKVGFERSVWIDGAKYMRLGNYVSIEPNVFLGVVKHPKYNSKKPRLIVGDGVGIGYGTVIFALNSVQIEKNAVLSPYCAIYDYNHGYQNTRIPINNQPLKDVNPVRIKDGAWIGTRATICPGVTIGKNAVIGANSVVTKDVPDYSLAVGVPARVIKRYNQKTNTWRRVGKNFKKEREKESSSPTVSIGIPTYEAGENLVSTLKSIYAQTHYQHIKEILVVVDGNPIPSKILSRIRNPKLKIVTVPQKGGQSMRINDIVGLLNTDLIVLTNDDVVLDKSAIESFVKELEPNSEALLAGNVLPMKPSSLLEVILEEGNKSRQEIGKQWNNGDNILLCNGRLLALTRGFAKKIRLNKNLWNSDAYMYIFAKESGVRFKFVEDAICWYRNPSKTKEHILQSMKFQSSPSENQKYFKNDISSYYNIPTSIKWRVGLRSLFASPVKTSAYVTLYILTRVLSKINSTPTAKQSFWETDQSTKKVQSI